MESEKTSYSMVCKQCDAGHLSNAENFICICDVAKELLHGVLCIIYIECLFVTAPVVFKALLLLDLSSSNNTVLRKIQVKLLQVRGQCKIQYKWSMVMYRSTYSTMVICMKICLEVLIRVVQAFILCMNGDHGKVS